MKKCNLWIGVSFMLCLFFAQAQQTLLSDVEKMDFTLTPYSATIHSNVEDTIELRLRNYSTFAVTDLKLSVQTDDELLEDIQLFPTTLDSIPIGATAAFAVKVAPKRTLTRKVTDVQVELEADEWNTERTFQLIIKPPRGYWQRIGIFATIVVVLLFAGTFLILNKQK